MAEFDAVAVLGLLIGLGWYALFLSEQRSKRPAEEEVEVALDATVIVDDFEEELEDDGYFEDEGSAPSSPN